MVDIDKVIAIHVIGAIALGVSACEQTATRRCTCRPGDIKACQPNSASSQPVKVGCLYFIASTLWGIMERKLLPKPKPVKLSDSDANDSPAKPGLLDRLKDAATGTTGNGETGGETTAERRKKRKKLK